MVKKKVEVKEVKEVKEEVAPVEVVDENKLVVGNVTHHLDRRDSGTNWNESDKLPSLNDPDQS